MTFTPTPPTKPGDYRWRETEDAESELVHVFLHNGHLEADGSMTYWTDLKSMGGEWSSRLVPVEEVKKAWIEALIPFVSWTHSQSRKIVEGEIEP